VRAGAVAGQRLRGSHHASGVRPGDEEHAAREAFVGGGGPVPSGVCCSQQSRYGAGAGASVGADDADRHLAGGVAEVTPRGWSVKPGLLPDVGPRDRWLDVPESEQSLG
jgi:hypothetical protein